MKLQFLGAARQVTGSCYYVEVGGLKLMVDCGMYQERSFRVRNWEPMPVSVRDLDYLLLTHAHLDHSGRIPKLVKEGFSKKILATEPTADLARIILLDSARLQEEDAEYKKRRHEREGRKGPYPELPLYTVEDAERSLPLFRNRVYGETFDLNERVAVRFHDAGHILGSSMIELIVKENGTTENIIFSGDVGQKDRPIVCDPTVFEQADYVVMESTYGDRDHEQVGREKEELAEVINDTVQRGGNIVVPTFAVERAQELMFYLSELVREDRIPHLMIFLDSPMAVRATEVFNDSIEYFDDETKAMVRHGEDPFEFPGLRLVRSVQESKAINRIHGSCVVMAGSGMCTGGRVKHHLVHNISDPESTVLFVGYQAKDTLGRHILDGETEVRIHGEMHQVRARIAQVHGFSAHAGKTDMLNWLGNFKTPLKTLFVTHGEEESALSFAEAVREKFKWNVVVPEYQQVWESGKG